MEKLIAVVGALTLVVVLVFGFSLIGAFFTKWLVNYLFTSVVISTLFGVAQLTFWKAFALNALVGGFMASARSSSK